MIYGLIIALCLAVHHLLLLSDAYEVIFRKRELWLKRKRTNWEHKVKMDAQKRYSKIGHFF